MGAANHPPIVPLAMLFGRPSPGGDGGPPWALLIVGLILPLVVGAVALLVLR